MKNINNCLDIDKITFQLERADLQKKRLICDIYRGYELYLDLVRDLLYISVERGLDELCGYLSIKNDSLNENKFFSLFEKRISKLIHTNLPLLTVEQLKINKVEKNVISENNIDTLENSSIKTNNDQKEKFQYEDNSQLEEPIEFKISEDIYSNPEYYQVENQEKLVSLNLDNNKHNNYSSNNNIIENIVVEKQFISSLLELIEVVKLEKPRYEEKDNLNQIDISPNYENFKNFDLIDNSLENLLLNFSYKINKELFKANLIKKMISKDSFMYLVEKKFMIKHPHPFVIEFELGTKQSSTKGDNYPSVIFFNISTIELEFKNLNLSVQRNKINELKNQFQRLIKKETYWRQKEITLNKIN